MAVRAGFKQTEVGVIPEDWDTLTLEELTTGLVRGPFGGALKKEFFVPQGYKVYEQRNAIYESTSIGNYFIDQNKYRELARFSVYPNDCIVSCSGTIGRIYQIPNGAPAGVINQALLKISLDSKKINDTFFISIFKSHSFQERIKENTHGGAMQNLVGMDVFRQTLLPVPPTLAEQESIAAALSDADALIAALEALIAKKRQIKQGAMQELLSVESGEWRVKSLGDECELITKGTTPTSLGKNFTNAGINFIKVETLNADGKMRDDMVAFIDEETHKLLKRSQLKENDLLISIAGALGRTGIVEKSILPANTNQALAIARLKPDAQFDLLYVYYYLKTEKIKKHIEGISVQGAQANLSLQNIAELPIYAPDIEKQTAIAGILSDMDAEIDMLAAKLSKVRQVKQGMMSQLLTGRVRLVNSGELIVNSEKREREK